MRSVRIVSGVLLLFIAIALSGCATTGFLGLATTKYVDRRISESDESMEEIDRKLDLAYEDYDENRERLNELETEIQDLLQAKEELESLVEVIRQNEEATAELQDLAVRLERELETIPEDTLILLAELIQDYLDKDGSP